MRKTSDPQGRGAEENTIRAVGKKKKKRKNLVGGGLRGAKGRPNQGWKNLGVEKAPGPFSREGERPESGGGALKKKPTAAPGRGRKQRCRGGPKLEKRMEAQPSEWGLPKAQNVNKRGKTEKNRQKRLIL